jgi:hypothetical protein
MFTPLSIVRALQLRAALGLTPSFALCVSARQDRIRRCRIVGKRRRVTDALAVSGSNVRGSNTHRLRHHPAAFNGTDSEVPPLLGR